MDNLATKKGNSWIIGLVILWVLVVAFIFVIQFFFSGCATTKYNCEKEIKQAYENGRETGKQEGYIAGVDWAIGINRRN